MVRVLRAGWLAPVLFLLGADAPGPSAGDTEADPPLHRGPEWNLCLTPHLVAVGRFVSISEFIETNVEPHGRIMLDYGVRLTTGDFLVERVLASRDRTTRPGETVQITVPGGYEEPGAFVWLDFPPPTAGDEWAVALHWMSDLPYPTILFQYKLPPGSIERFPRDPVGQLTLEGYCADHREGLYWSDVYGLMEEGAFQRYLPRSLKAARARE